MPNILPITVPNPDEILNDGAYGANADIRVQSAPTQNGTFADLSGTGSTPLIPIEHDRVSYPAYDPNGLTTDWYRIRFENVGATRLSDWSEPRQASTGPATAVGTYAQLPGVKMRLGRDTSNTADDEILQKYCDQVNARMETLLRAPICPIASATYLFNGFDAVDQGRSLLVPWGVRSVSLIRVAPQTNGTFLTVASTDYVILPPAMQRQPVGAPGDRISFVDFPVSGTTSRFYPGFTNVEVTMTCGWDFIPDDLVDCGETTAVRAFQSRRTGQGDVVGSDDMGRTIISRILATEWREVIRSYRSEAIG